MSTNVFWIDINIDKKRNEEYIKKLNSNLLIKFQQFKDIETAMKQLKEIKFEETKIIISDSLYPEFIKSLKEKILDLCVVPKIIIFTKNKENFIKLNKNYDKNEFFIDDGIVTSYDEIKKLLKDNEIKEIKIEEDVQLTFEYIDKKEKLILPLFFKSLIDIIPNDNIEKYTKYLYETYANENENLKKLLGSIVSINNIPIEILSKYYSRLYTADSNFHRNINRDLGLNLKDKYLSFIKVLYEGVKLKSLPLADDKTKFLYRGAKISNEEINNIKNYINKKIEGLPSSIVFSKSFLSFSKVRSAAEEFLKDENKNKNISKVLFILEKDDNIGYNLSTHCDIEDISFYPNEREVLFFPFSSFEIKSIKEINKKNEKRYEIKLLYLGKYLKEIEKDKNLIKNDILIPEDSEFKKQIEEFGIIEREKNLTTNEIFNEYKIYENEINRNNNIIGEIVIDCDNINKDIQIINSFENYKRIHNFASSKDDIKYKNKKEIEENTEIKINGKLIKFSYTYKFEKEGKYKIKYFFKNILTKTNHMFDGCNSLTSLNLSNFNTQNELYVLGMYFINLFKFIKF